MRGWHWLLPPLIMPFGDLNAGPAGASTGSVTLEKGGYAGDLLGGRIYSRSLLNSEVIANFRAGPPAAA